MSLKKPSFLIYFHSILRINVTFVWNAILWFFIYTTRHFANNFADLFKQEIYCVQIYEFILFLCNSIETTQQFSFHIFSTCLYVNFVLHDKMLCVCKLIWSHNIHKKVFEMQRLDNEKKRCYHVTLCKNVYFIITNKLFLIIYYLMMSWCW